MPLVLCLHLGPLHRPDRGRPQGREDESDKGCAKYRDRGDYFELTDRQTSSSAKNVADDDLTWFAIEVVE